MARCLIIGCGCRGRALAGELLTSGHVVRGTTRDPDHVAAIEAAGAEGFVGDPDRVGTLSAALAHVAVVYVLLGSAVGAPEELAALHATRLEMLLHRMRDSTVRGIVYEAVGTVDPAVRRGGAERVREFCDDSRVPFVLLVASPLDRRHWLREASGAMTRLLGGESSASMAAELRPR